jgi:hypothetical protein
MAATILDGRRSAAIFMAAMSALLIWIPARLSAATREIVLVSPDAADPARCAAWRKEGFGAVALVLDEQSPAATLGKAAEAAAANSLDVYLWIEVGRCPELAREHPEWMAALGSHDDWQSRFPKIRLPEKDEVAKAWPWVPIGYQEASRAHLARIDKLLERAPAGFKGHFLNDLQGGPASCGCGNLQCRWALDYRVASTATKLDGPNPAVRFLAAVAKSAKGKLVIPVWVSECEQEDLPDSKRAKGSWGTGYCGTVPCLETCRKRFAEQWTALQTDRDGPTALLALHQEFQRDRKEYGTPCSWVAQTWDYYDKHSTRPVPRQRLWPVLQGYNVRPEIEAALRNAASKAGMGAVVVARTRIDQSFEPRIVKVK